MGIAYIIGGFIVFLFVFMLIADAKRFFFKNSNTYSNQSEKEYQVSDVSGTTEKLIEMKNKWEELDIVPYFTESHHFSSERFNSEAPTLYEHCDYCIGKKIQGENIQTLERCLKVAKLYGNGLDIDEAIEQSWLEYPILRT